MRPETRKTIEAAGTAISVAAWVAVPDYATTRTRRFALRSVIVLGSSFTAYALHRDQETDEQEDNSDPFPDASNTTFALIGAGALAASGVTNHLTKRGTRYAAGLLTERGVRRPWTLVGIAAGVVSFAADRLSRHE